MMQNLNLMLGFDAQQYANNTLSVVGLVDPTGITGVVTAYNYPKCSNDDAFPSITILK